MADLTQIKSTLLSHAAGTHPFSVEGTPVSVATALSCLVVLWHAFIESVTNTNPPSFRLFGSLDASGDENWFHIMDVDVTDEDNVAEEAMTATEGVGETVLAVAVTTGFAAKDTIYVRDVGTEADSEWHTIDIIVAATSIDIMMGLTTAKDSSDVITGGAQQFSIPLSCAGLSRIRVDYSNEGATSANTAFKAEVLVATDFE